MFAAGSSDLGEPERILQVCHPDLERDLPKLRTLEGPGDMLPTQLTSFIGRDHEISEISEIVGLLRDRRLVTLTGPGGAGTTRLRSGSFKLRHRSTEFVDIAIGGLEAFIDAHDHHPDELEP